MPTLRERLPSEAPKGRDRWTRLGRSDAGSGSGRQNGENAGDPGKKENMREHAPQHDDDCEADGDMRRLGDDGLAGETLGENAPDIDR